jgi:hypothetical protein
MFYERRPDGGSTGVMTFSAALSFAGDLDFLGVAFFCCSCIVINICLVVLFLITNLFESAD